MNYFRITAYNRDEDYSIIIDSYGAFNELWQFSSCLVDKGFSIIAVGNENFFEEGNIPKVKEEMIAWFFLKFLKHNPLETETANASIDKPNAIKNKVKVSIFITSNINYI